MRDIRGRYPIDTTVYIVMDNLSAHWTPAIRAWAADTTNNVALLPTQTYASWLNRIWVNRPSGARHAEAV